MVACAHAVPYNRIMNNSTKVKAGHGIRRGIGNATREQGAVKLSRVMKVDPRTLLAAVTGYPIAYGRLMDIKAYLQDNQYMDEPNYAHYPDIAEE